MDTTLVAMWLVIEAGEDGGFEVHDGRRRVGAAELGTIAGYCRVTEGLDSGGAVDAEAIVRPGAAPRAVPLEME